tara:strand:- start:2306 stop:2959 length:654 start_codon:yes stop_codon:yes gene_type:complete
LKKLFLFKVFVFLFITLFCVLGTWQLYRLQWKQDLINDIKKGLESDPILYTSDLNKNYQRVKLSGEYIFKKQIYLYSLNQKGVPGYDVITPFQTTNKENVLINRGWIQKDKKNKLPMISTLTDITGMLRMANRRNIFTPENDIKENIWFYLNSEDIEKSTGMKFSNYIVYLEDKNIKIPQPKKITIDLPNNHLKYAITWYSISISILFYYLYFRRNK